MSSTSACSDAQSSVGLERVDKHWVHTSSDSLQCSHTTASTQGAEGTTEIEQVQTWPAYHGGLQGGDNTWGDEPRRTDPLTYTSITPTAAIDTGTRGLAEVPYTRETLQATNVWTSDSEKRTVASIPTSASILATATQVHAVPSGPTVSASHPSVLPPLPSASADGASIGAASKSSSSNVHVRAIAIAVSASLGVVAIILLLVALAAYMNGGVPRGRLLHGSRRWFASLRRNRGVEEDGDSILRSQSLEAGGVSSVMSHSQTGGASLIPGQPLPSTTTATDMSSSLYSGPGYQGDVHPVRQMTLVSQRTLSLSSIGFPSTEQGESAECLGGETSPTWDVRENRDGKEWSEIWRQWKATILSRWRGEDCESTGSPAGRFYDLPSATSSMMNHQKPQLTFNPELPLPPIVWNENSTDENDKHSSRFVRL